jgi:hypothetical protein
MLLFNVDPKTREIREASPPVMATQGRNDWGEVQYGGPKPPSDASDCKRQALKYMAASSRVRGCCEPRTARGPHLCVFLNAVDQKQLVANAFQRCEPKFCGLCERLDASAISHGRRVPPSEH